MLKVSYNLKNVDYPVFYIQFKGINYIRLFNYNWMLHNWSFDFSSIKTTTIHLRWWYNSEQVAHNLLDQNYYYSFKMVQWTSCTQSPLMRNQNFSYMTSNHIYHDCIQMTMFTMMHTDDGWIAISVDSSKLKNKIINNY